MASATLPSPQDIQSVVEEEVAGAGGTILDRVGDDRRLFLRAVLPSIREIRPSDRVQAGIAVMALGPEVRVHPFTYREVCRNGAIMAQVIDTRRIERVESDAPAYAVDEVLARVREAVRQCAAPEVFAEVADQLVAATITPASMAIQMLPMLIRARGFDAARFLAHMLGEYDHEGDDTLFGLMNAVTRVARNHRNPRVRWDLEELGGGIPALVPDDGKPSDAAADVLEPVFGR
jgi:hypothetical protein